MSLYLKRSIFDLLKIGIGPSSSHTLGPFRMARHFRENLIKSGQKIQRISVTLKGSLAHTGKGHLTPNALCAGLLGLDPISSPIEEIQNAREDIRALKGFYIGEQWISSLDRNLIRLDKTSQNFRHPNTAIFKAFDLNDKVLLKEELCSIGGGDFISVTELKPALERAPTSKLSFQEILEVCEVSKKSIIDWAYEQESLLSGKAKTEVHKDLNGLFQLMQVGVDAGLSKEGLIPGKLGVRRRAKNTHRRLEKSLADLVGGGPIVSKAGIYAMAVSEENASGGRIVTAPTCGA